MISGRITGDYEYSYESRGALNQNIGQNQLYTWATQLDLSKGLWMVQLLVKSSLRNLNIEFPYIVAEGQFFRSAGSHNAESSPTIETVSLLTIIDDLRIRSSNPQDLRVNFRGGIGGGRLVDAAIVLIAFKKKSSRGVNAIGQKKEGKKK